MIEGSRVEGAGGAETARGEREVKEQEGFAKKEGERSWGKGLRIGRERGRRGQGRKRVINEGRAARWKDEEGEMERMRE